MGSSSFAILEDAQLGQMSEARALDAAKRGRGGDAAVEAASELGEGVMIKKARSIVDFLAHGLQIKRRTGLS